MYTAIHRLYNHFHLYRHIFFFFLTCTLSTKKVVAAFIEHTFPQESDIKAVTFNNGTYVACLSYGTIFPEMMSCTEHTAGVNASIITVFDCTTKQPLYQYNILMSQSEIHFNKPGDILLTWQKGGIGCLQSLHHLPAIGTRTQEKETYYKEYAPHTSSSQLSKFSFSTSPTLKALPQRIQMARWGANNNLAVLSVFGELCVINAHTGITQYKVPGTAWGMTWSSCCDFFVVAKDKGSQISWNSNLEEILNTSHPSIDLFTANGKLLQEYPLDYDYVNALSFIKDNRLFLCSEKEDNTYLHSWIMLDPSFLVRYFLECHFNKNRLFPIEIACMISNYIEPLHHCYSLKVNLIGQSITEIFYGEAPSIITMLANKEIYFWNPHTEQQLVKLYGLNFIKPLHGGNFLVWYDKETKQLCLAKNNICIVKQFKPLLQHYKKVLDPFKIMSCTLQKRYIFNQQNAFCPLKKPKYDSL